MFDFTNVLQLVQSLEVLRILGVSRVVVYKTSCSPETQRLLDYYTNTGFVEVIPWSITRFVNVSRSWLPQHGPGDLHYFGQITALNDCLYRYMYQTRYMALHDVDELILPHTVDSWSELLPQLEQKHGADLCFKFENTVFPNTIFTLPPTSPSPQLPVNLWQGVTGVNILAHLRYEYSLSNKVYNFKIIINPRPVFSVTVHGVLESKKDCIWVSTSDARMHHTRAPVQPESADQLIYDGRLLDYSSRLIPSVSAVLRTAGLISEDDGG
ncbi:uncharacterized protein LOC117509385 isoform X1 [Thalassophryne amazonica]|uniref:uncharacterized protein LOC117509385 isoform X1 n=1 Tax=Thalassophryne amazonica TaxID=390379 RepID=UPI001471857F|nr:uncharacterized protein LOC117509385 isoform X1 [Thalassophryne amazonica]